MVNFLATLYIRTQTDPSRVIYVQNNRSHTDTILFDQTFEGLGRRIDNGSFLRRTSWLILIWVIVDENCTNRVYNL